MTSRQIEVLRMVRETVEKGEPWINLGLSSVPGDAKGPDPKGPRISWEELNWLTDFEKQALLTRIDAALLVANTVEHRRALEGASLEGGDVPAATCDWPVSRCTR